MTEKAAGWSVTGFGQGNERTCPYCGTTVATAHDEIAHMSSMHPGIVTQRLMDAGIHPDEVADYRQGPDLPSHMTLHEFRQVAVFVEWACAQDGGTALDHRDVSILVRDRGPGSGVKAPWIEFAVGGRKFAMWRYTFNLYEIGPDGAVGDDPIFVNESPRHG